MIKKIYFKFFIIALGLASCDGPSIFSRSTIDPYTITKKTPLIMPPDMQLRPPGTQESSMSNRKKLANENLNEENLSVDDILFGTNQKIIKNSKSMEKKIIKNILKSKSGAILK